MRKKTRFITSPQTKQVDGNALDSFISVVLFGENHGYRMKSYGPIPLTKIEGSTLIQRQVESIKATFKNFEIILCSGFETQKTVEFVKDNFADINIRVVENQMHFNSNCCESARLCINNINNDKILFCGGGIIMTPESLRGIDYRMSTILYQDEDDYKDFDIGVIHSGGELTALALGIKARVWTEIIYLSSRKSIKSLYNTVSNPDYKNRFMFEAINELVKNNRIVVKHNDHKSVIKINNIKTLRRITKI